MRNLPEHGYDVGVFSRIRYLQIISGDQHVAQERDFIKDIGLANHLRVDEDSRGGNGFISVSNDDQIIRGSVMMLIAGTNG
jgi:hypothetical protein